MVRANYERSSAMPFKMLDKENCSCLECKPPKKAWCKCTNSCIDNAKSIRNKIKVTLAFEERLDVITTDTLLERQKEVDRIRKNNPRITMETLVDHKLTQKVLHPNLEKDKAGNSTELEKLQAAFNSANTAYRKQTERYYIKVN